MTINVYSKGVTNDQDLGVTVYSRAICMAIRWELTNEMRAGREGFSLAAYGPLGSRGFCLAAGSRHFTEGIVKPAGRMAIQICLSFDCE